MRKRSSKSTSLDSVLQEDLLYDWIVETEKQAVQEDEVLLEHELKTYLTDFLLVVYSAYESELGKKFLF